MTPMDFSGSYEGLIEKCESVAVVMTRDLTELAVYNITAGVVSDFIDETEAFDLLPNDNLLESLQMTAPPTAAPTGLQVNMMTLLLTWLAVAGASGYKVKYKFSADSGSYVDARDGILCFFTPRNPPHNGRAF